MTYSKAHRAAQQGSSIRRQAWPAGYSAFYCDGEFVESAGDGHSMSVRLYSADILACDWEVVQDALESGSA